MSRLAAFISPGKSLPQALDRVKLAESLGYETVFSTHTTGRDGLMTLAAYANATSTIKLGTGVLPAFPRHPLSLGIEAATLDEISGGRLVLGVGASHQLTMETWYGIPMDKAFSRMREYVAILRQLFTKDGVDFKGEYYKVQYGFLGYGARHDLPIMVAALGPRMLHWAGGHTEGTILWACMPTYIREVVTPTITSAAKEAGRTVDIVAAIPTALTTNKAAAYDGLRRDFFVYMTLPFYRRAIAGAGFEADLKAFDEANAAGDFPGSLAAISAEMLDHFAAVGDAGRIKEKYAEYRDAGVTLPAVGLFNAGEGFAGVEETLKAALGS
jgi:alkanesulfonate monooxygenase SsuD/methylene tetrahydromethanopterin reductase-like flavin-dependent oxidoreductase (luciferase family)